MNILWTTYIFLCSSRTRVLLARIITKITSPAKGLFDRLYRQPGILHHCLVHLNFYLHLHPRLQWAWFWLISIYVQRRQFSRGTLGGDIPHSSAIPHPNVCHLSGVRFQKFISRCATPTFCILKWPLPQTKFILLSPQGMWKYTNNTSEIFFFT